MVKKSFFILKIIIGLLLFFLVLRYKFDFSAISEVQFAWHILLITVIISIITNLIRTLKWQIILNDVYDYGISFSETLKYIFIGQFFAFFTPSRLGDLVRVRYVKKKLGYKKSFSSLIIERVTDIAIILVFFILALFYFKNQITSKISIGLSIWIIIIVIILAISSYIIFNKKINKFIEENFPRTKILNARFLIKIIIVSIGVWISTYILFYFSAMVVNTPIGLIDSLAIASIHALIILIPISINGIGLREGSALILFPLIAVQPEIGIVIAWIVALNNSLLPAIIGYIVFLSSKK